LKEAKTLSKTSTSAALRSAALRFVADRGVLYLLQIGEPAKTGQITGFVSEEHAVSGKVVRDALTLDPRFVQRERRWDLTAREIDSRRPMERLIEDLLGATGRPLRIDTIGVEIAKATDTPPEVVTATIRRMVTTRPRFKVLSAELVIPSTWVIDVKSGGTPEDVLFAEFEDEANVDKVRAFAKGVKWADPAAAAEAIVGKAGEPVSAKAIAYLAYESNPGEFDAIAFQTALIDSSLTLLSDGTVLSPKLVDALTPIWDTMADEPPVEGAPEEAARPVGEIAITPADLEEIAVIIRRAEGFITSRQILEQVLEVNTSDRDYEKWEAVLATALQEQGEVIGVGWDRWRRVETIPTNILDAPTTLDFQSYSFQTLEGEELDAELTEDGFDGNLKTLVAQPIGTSGGECKKESDGSARCAITILHHESGTLPIGGEDPYFPTEPPLLEATLIGPNGKFPLWINNQLGLAFGLDSITHRLPESGGVFTLTPTNRPGEYRIEISAEPDQVLGIDDARLKELRAIATRPTFADTSNFDLIGEFLERHRKGADFYTLLAEMWVIRPVTADLVASILSEYHCFKQNKNGSWSFDPREVDKGFKKAKRKYVK
jgi:hypothetical protein